MQNIKKQQGVGMVEVLVALVILAIGVLGFTALQLRAVDATSEALYRIQAMNLARDLAERIRANQDALRKSIEKTGQDDQKYKISPYVNAFGNNTSLSEYDWANAACYNTIASNSCDSAEMADEDVKQVLYKAGELGMSMALRTCEGVINGRHCIYVSWGKTTPTEGTSDTDCTSGGSYIQDSRCIVLEAY